MTKLRAIVVEGGFRTVSPTELADLGLAAGDEVSLDVKRVSLGKPRVRRGSHSLFDLKGLVAGTAPDGLSVEEMVRSAVEGALADRWSRGERGSGR